MCVCFAMCTEPWDCSLRYANKIVSKTPFWVRCRTTSPRGLNAPLNTGVAPPSWYQWLKNQLGRTHFGRNVHSPRRSNASYPCRKPVTFVLDAATSQQVVQSLYDVFYHTPRKQIFFSSPSRLCPKRGCSVERGSQITLTPLHSR